MVGTGTTVTDAVLTDSAGRHGTSGISSDLRAALFDDEPLASAAAGWQALPLSVDEDLRAVEADWRRFQGGADCTVFQTFEWLAAWHRHLGERAGIRPAIVSARDDGGELLFLFPLAVERRGLVRRLTWLGRDLCDYNAPLLAPDFVRRVGPEHFSSLWRDVRALLQSRPHLRHDLVELDKMPATVGGQRTLSSSSA
jgi:CelD/BcsL family acetyltransferase involved in cellulose biosynthesis